MHVFLTHEISKNSLQGKRICYIHSISRLFSVAFTILLQTHWDGQFAFSTIQMAKPFLEPKTANKVKFVYSDDPTTNNIMDELFDMEMVEYAFGGKDEEDFDISKYALRMRKDDEKLPFVWQTHRSLIPLPPPPPPHDPTAINFTSSDTDSEASDIKADKAAVSIDEDEDEEGAKHY